MFIEDFTLISESLFPFLLASSTFYRGLKMCSIELCQSLFSLGTQAAPSTWAQRTFHKTWHIQVLRDHQKQRIVLYLAQSLDWWYARLPILQMSNYNLFEEIALLPDLWIIYSEIKQSENLPCWVSILASRSTSICTQPGSEMAAKLLTLSPSLCWVYRGKLDSLPLKFVIYNLNFSTKSKDLNARTLKNIWFRRILFKWVISIREPTL